ncbi:hypothetical protein MJO55_25780 [Mycolicibacterium rufum]|uniref:DUF732 domain-containing protein n=1 Tax=Mycolicibacterium rufum TaxID=318424 RepID=A0A9X3BG27_9MYCO|nr:hypothetical protein [Mycolicibacterium rufum]MCV7070779.1 hypothetical protein [Mycolicibacterium rufum]ULP36550.1 hypothetical protein MJO55_25780 [Mycolicibacterium rufum]
MKTRVRVTTATLAGLAIALGVTTACQRTTEGAVAQTTQPGPPLTTEPSAPTGLPSIPGLPDITIPNLPLPTRGTDVPVVPPPPNATSMTCEEYNGLDEPTRVAVVRAILEQGSNPLGPNGETVGQLLADAACQFLPSAKVSDVLMGS